MLIDLPKLSLIEEDRSLSGSRVNIGAFDSWPRKSGSPLWVTNRVEGMIIGSEGLGHGIGAIGTFIECETFLIL